MNVKWFPTTINIGLGRLILDIDAQYKPCTQQTIESQIHSFMLNDSLEN